MPRETRPERELRADIKELKNPAPYQEKFENKETQELMQAIDILDKLADHTMADSSRIGHDKLRHAQMYLDQLLKEHF